jgi:hypothetical protein
MCADLSCLAPCKVIMGSYHGMSKQDTMALLKEMKVHEPSQDTYASAAHRFVKFAVDFSGVKSTDALPRG